MSELSQLLPQERRISFAGKEWSVKPLTFNSLARIEDKYGSLEKMDLGKVTDQRFLLWVILGASDPALTEEAVGELLTIDKMEQVVAFIGQALEWSGLTASPGERETPPEKNAATRKATHATGA